MIGEFEPRKPREPEWSPEALYGRRPQQFTITSLPPVQPMRIPLRVNRAVIDEAARLPEDWWTRVRELARTNPFEQESPLFRRLRGH